MDAGRIAEVREVVPKGVEHGLGLLRLPLVLLFLQLLDLGFELADLLVFGLDFAAGLIQDPLHDPRRLPQEPRGVVAEGVGAEHPRGAHGAVTAPREVGSAEDGEGNPAGLDGEPLGGALEAIDKGLQGWPPGPRRDLRKVSLTEDRSEGVAVPEGGPSD